MSRPRRAQRLAGAGLAAAAVLCSSAATAKDFEPGDVSICNAKRCIPITKLTLLRALSAFYYSGRRPSIVRAPRKDAPAFELRFDDGRRAGLVASARLDRALVYGLNCGRFRRGTWYRVPARIALELRWLVGRLKPLHIPASPPRSC